MKSTSPWGTCSAGLAEREQYQREMRRASDVMRRMQAEDLPAWQEYLAESRAFEAGAAGDGLGAAAAEWPEYNTVSGSASGAIPGR